MAPSHYYMDEYTIREEVRTQDEGTSSVALDTLPLCMEILTGPGKDWTW